MGKLYKGQIEKANVADEAEEIEKKEAHLKLMRQRYASLAATAIMFADDSGGPPASVDEDEEEEDKRWIGEILMEEGDLLDSQETDTGNPMSGDFVGTESFQEEALRWIRRVEYFEREGGLFRSESL